ncbi:Non-specific lipid-transfer protein [Corchorus capsularis]|uniref:Non-specific lipid-transfer protein n=1 Tax=Corchorus capsularis TaxID=210143 RepID=A0A1R3GLX8_COCAP|nr:Non-specific lipid-transfer protein [Corchorus capsularis]
MAANLKILVCVVLVLVVIDPLPRATAAACTAVEQIISPCVGRTGLTYQNPMYRPLCCDMVKKLNNITTSYQNCHCLESRMWSFVTSHPKDIKPFFDFLAQNCPDDVQKLPVKFIRDGYIVADCDK